MNVRELRNHGGDVLDRVEAGETVTIVRAGRPIAQLSPLPSRGLDPATLLERWRHLPHVDPVAFRADIDAAVDQSL